MFRSIRKVVHKIQTVHGTDNELIQAIKDGDIDQIEKVIARGLDLKKKIYTGDRVDSEYPLSYAIRIGEYNQIKVVECLLKHHADPTLSLYQATDSNNEELVALLLKYDANPNYVNARGDSPLCLAVRNRYKTEIIKNLIEKNADINFVGPDGCTPLMSATTLNTIQLLLEHGADAKIKNKHGQNLLSVAAEKNRQEIVDYFLMQKMTLNLKDNLGNTPLHYAARNANLKLIQQCLDAHMDINAQNERKETPLICAVRRENITLVEYFLQKGASLNHFVPCDPAYRGGTKTFNELTLAINRHDLAMTKLLLKHGASMNTQDYERYRSCNTPLQEAEESKSEDILIFLRNYKLITADKGVVDDQHKISARPK